MADDYEARELFFSRRPDKTIVSGGFAESNGRRLRIASKVVDGSEGLKFANVEGEVTLRVTPSGRYLIKATFLEDDRGIETLTIQRYHSKSGPLDRESFSFRRSEIDALLGFIAGIKTMPFADEKKVHVSDEALRDLVLDRGLAHRVFAKNPDLFLEIAQFDNLERDLIAVGYRRRQLDRFNAFLAEPGFFQSECERLALGPEALWQAFFEANSWIFGYGLSYQFLTGLDDRKLEQIVRGYDLSGPGKRVDALMRTRGVVGSLCFVEIKRHDTRLLAQGAYRSGAWAPSAELVGGIAQLQATVHDAAEAIGRRIEPTDAAGNPTGEKLFNLHPRSVLVVGQLSEFETPDGVNESKFRSFELFRRNTQHPEIITFDELLHRARFIVEEAPDCSVASGYPRRPEVTGDLH